MKTYSGNDLIKVAKYRQSALGFLGKLERRGFSIDNVTVEDSTATFHLKGEQDGQTITLDVPVKKNKGELGAVAKCGKFTLNCESFDLFSSCEYAKNKLELWLNSVTKLDTKEAIDGTLPMPIELWMSIPRHKEFYEQIKKDFRRYLRFDDWIKNTNWLIRMAGETRQDGCGIKPLPQLVYSSKINDFILDNEHEEITFNFGFTSQHTAFIHYKWYVFLLSS